jgi:hypothetical protein
MEHLLKKLTTLSYEKQIPTASPDSTATAPTATTSVASTAPVAPIATTPTAKPLTIEPVKHNANAFPQWKGRQPKNPGLAPVGTVTGSTANIPPTRKSAMPAEDEIVAESKKRIK